MRTTWRVTKVTATEGQTIAEMARVAWFKKNPLWSMSEDEIEAADPDLEWCEEFIDIEGPEQGADFVEFPDGSKLITIDITNGLDLAPGDNVVITIDALDRVST